MSPIATVECDHAFIKVKINGLLHLSVLRNELLAIQAWHVDATLWQIEYVSKGGAKVRSDYTSRELWEQVLVGLDKVPVALD